MSAEAESTIRVRYAETDAQGVAHHASYLVWFEEGRSELLRRRGLSYRSWEEAGRFLVVTGVEVGYRAPARFDDLLLLRTTLDSVRRSVLEFSYQLLHQDGTLVAEGRTRHLLIDRKSRRPVRLPVDLLQPVVKEKTHREA